MKQDLVEVELIVNPEITRIITRSNYNLNTQRWRLRGAPIVEPEKKDQDAGLVVTSNPQQNTPPPATPDPNPLLEGLRTQYTGLSGKKPDGRWNLARLSKEIKALETPESTPV